MLPLYALLAAAVVTGGLWALLAARWFGLSGACLATIVCGVVFGPPYFHIATISLDRLLLVGVIMLATWQWKTGEFRWGSLQRSDLCLAAWIGWITLSTFTHDWSELDGFPLSTLVFYYLIPAALYGVGRGIEWTPQRHRGLLLVFTVLGVYLGLTGLAEATGFRAAVFPRYINSPDIIEFFGRGRGPLLNPIGNGIYLTLGIATAWLSAARLPGRWRAIGPVLIALPLLGCYATLTRSVWMGAALAMALLGYLTIPRRVAIPVLATAVLAGSLVAATQWEHLKSFKRDENVSVADMQQSAELRPILATLAWKVFQDYPFTGVGFGQYLVHSRQYINERTFGLPLEEARGYIQHNIVLSLLTETGLIGVALYLSVMVCWSLTAWRLARRSDLPTHHRQLHMILLALFATYAVNGMFHELSVIPMVNVLVFFLCGLSTRTATQWNTSELVPRGWAVPRGPGFDRLPAAS